MTQRERQILRWIEENPMISQQELAEKAGITRSSIAVHISNLMKKGHIAGKGYIVRTAPYAVVVGGVNMDIGGWSQGPLIPRDSNPGRVRMSLGGVGRNIAHNLCLLGADVRLLTAFGDDMSAQKLAASCGELGIDISQALQVPGAATSTYLFLAGPDGDMELAVSDMDIYRHVTPAYLSARSALLDNAQLIIVDANIPEESIAWLAANAKVPLFADPVSTTKAAKLKGSLGRLHTLKPNRIEAELLSGVPITGEESLHRCADALLATGLRRVFISLGGGRGVRRRPQRPLPAPLPPCQNGQHHRLRRRLHGGHRLGLPGGHGPGGHRPGGPGGLRHRHGERGDHQPGHERRGGALPHGSMWGFQPVLMLLCRCVLPMQG